jgi:phosphoribosylaminoimidazolecarboxamide formyltransferase/IMP cyclohydrolase
VLAFNRPLDARRPSEVAKLFVECIVAPGYDAGALERSRKKNLRLLEIEPGTSPPGRAGIEANFGRRAGAGSGPFT